MDGVKTLMKKKDDIEEQIKAYYDVLEDVSWSDRSMASCVVYQLSDDWDPPTDLISCGLQQGVGVGGALVDAEGYPRADVNIYHIRTARHNISCKHVTW